MIADFIYQMLLVALVAVLLIDMGRLHKKLNEINTQLQHLYYLLYYQYYSTYHHAAESQKELEKEEAVDGDVDRVKEACIVELVSKRGCVAVEEVATLCNASKSFILNKLYRKRKVVRVDKEGRVCPR
ncbi:MAG: hypothetical protein ACO2PN_20550 [Pyrobaculum sp.]|jgi:excinuclease UvrABC helicase subunit UvrB